jgi:hypothetical protein
LQNSYTVFSVFVSSCEDTILQDDDDEEEEKEDASTDGSTSAISIFV